MNKEVTYRILIGGGGTGGHVFPAISIADALGKLEPGARFLFVGARGKLEMEKVPEAGYEIEGLPVAGFQRRITFSNLAFFFRLAASMMISRRIIRRYRPHVAVGVGGYASGPILKAAARKGIPVLIQEQNSYAGVTNRLLARSARTICVAYDRMEHYFPAGKIVLTGNPVRRNLVSGLPGRALSIREFGLEEARKTCLVVGGSLGARTINDSMALGLQKMARPDMQVLWQCGEIYREEVDGLVDRSGLKNVKVLPFIARMDLAYAAADVIVSRAGAITISELCIIGKPVILVPSPNVAEDHQTRNAEALVAREAAVMVADQDARDVLVDTMLDLMENGQKRDSLSGHIKQLGIPDASDRIAAEVLKLMTTE